MDPLLVAAWRARLFRFRMVRPSPQVWPALLETPFRSEGSVRRGFCSTLPPHDGFSFREVDADLGGSNVCRFAIREDRSVLPAAAVRQAGERLALSLYKAPFSTLGRGLQGRLKVKAEAEVRSLVPWQTKIVQAWMIGEFLWLSPSSVAEDVSTQEFLWSTLGPADMVPGAWTWEAGTPGWSALSRAAVSMVCSSNSVFLPFDSPSCTIELSKVDVATGSSLLKLDAPLDRSMDVLRAAVSVRSTTLFPKLGFRVRRSGSTTSIEVDERGLCVVNPPPSAGGRVSARWIRRHEDALASIEVLRLVLKNVLDKALV